MDLSQHKHVFLPDLWKTHAKFFPEKEAIVCGNVRRNWRDFNRNMNRIANQLISEGIGRGHKVAVLMDNSVDILEIIYGIVRSGACVVPLSGLLTTSQVEGLMNDSGSVAVFCSKIYQEKIDHCRSNLHAVRENGYISHDFEGGDWRTYPSFVASASPEYPYVSYDIQDDFNLIYSSGTTGLPKGILQSHGARLHWSFSNAIELRYHVDSRALTTTALYSNGTWLAILPVLFAGGTLVILPEFSAKEFLNTVQKEKITHTFMVPTQFIVTLDSPDFDNYNLSSLEAVLCGGSPLRPDTKLEVLKRMTPNLYELYGYSEGFATMNKPGTNQLKPDSVGTPVLGFDVKIVGDDDTEAKAGDVGEIVGYGAGMMSGYHNNPNATEAILWTSPDGRNFIRSGDIGRLDEDGFLYILDRKKDMIISGGFNVFPADIESIIGEHPAVLDVTVIGVPHDKWGETPLALIIPHDGTTENEILTWSNQNLAKHQRLSGVKFRTEFPRNALGKVLKRVLRDEHSYFPDRKSDI